MIRNIRILTRSILAFGIMGVFTLLLGIFSISQLSRLNNDVTVITEHRMPAALLVGALNRDFLITRVNTMNFIYATTEQERKRYLERLNEVSNDYQQSVTALRGYIQTPEARKIFDQVISLRNDYDNLQQQLIRMVTAGDQQQAQQFREQGFTELSLKITNALNDLATYQQERASVAARDAHAVFETSVVAMITGIIISLIFVAVLAAIFSRSIILPIQKAVTATQTIADGNLTRTIEDDGKDETAMMLSAVNAMQNQLKNTLRAIGDSSNQLAATSEELSAVTEQSTRTMHQQSEELEQAATAVTELTTAIEEVARNATATSQESDTADEKAQQGRQKVQETIRTIEGLVHDIQHTMKGVEQLAVRVNDIGSVLDVIRAIAEQTNLLALNAAIEAARAGESGRGFAVVADEVRALAHRTQESTKEIESMMKSVQADTDNTVKAMQTSNQRATDTLSVANEAGEALKQIAHGISQINEQNITIASAAEEQATVAREVDRNLVNIRDLAAQTASGANETSASSAELARLAEELNQLIMRFKM
ncbi:methyl-accepting chemotaxis protein [Chromatiaceae bacterium AAb-1]|nr:methyl-accepting chemotaxis protein [Chromatiaceae bacterium AAb-1]